MKKALFTFMIALLLSFNLKAADENAVWDGVDDGGVVVVPKALAVHCKISAESVNRMADVIKCINDILRLKGDEDGNVSNEATRLTNLLIREVVYANVAEGMAMKQYAFDFPKTVLADLSEKLEAGGNAKEMLSNIMTMEKESAYLQNNLLKVKSSEMQFNSIFEISNFRGKIE